MRNVKKATRSYGYHLGVIAIIGCTLAACSDNTANNKLGSLPTASFTATPLSSNPNKIAVKSTTKDAFMWSWDFGNGQGSANETDTVTYIKKGNYTIKLTVFNHGGSASAAKQVAIANDDASGVQVLANGGKLDAADWKTLNTGGTPTTVAFADGTANFSNTGDSNGGIYQAVQVEAGATYLFSAEVKGAGATNTWFEIYFGTTVPAAGSDYTDNKFVSLNTWSGCGTTPFDGDIANIGCAGNGTGAGGIITFPTSGTVYLVVKAGSSGGTMGAGGITLENISLMKL